MLDSETAKYFYDALSVIITENITARKKLLNYFRLYKELINNILSKENRVFSSYFSKTVFLIDNYRIPEEITSVLKKFRLFASSAARNKNYDVRDYYTECGLLTIAKLIQHFSDIDIPQTIANRIAKLEYTEKYISSKKLDFEKIDEIRCVVLKKKKYENNLPEITCVSEDFGTINILLNSPWNELYHFIWEKAVINVINIACIDNENNIYKTIANSLIVLEPDYLMDSTDLAECFQNTGANPNLYFLKKFCNSKANEGMIAGNLINSCLDELLLNPMSEFDEIYDRSLMQKPLQIFSLALKNSSSVQRIREKVSTQFTNLKEIIKQIPHEIITVEPSFISPMYGLQGRLDVLLEYYDDKLRKDIIELKSGKGPDDHIMITTHDGKKISSKVWNNNLAQTTCYNLMLDSSFPGRYGTSSILYSSTLNEPIRNAENIHQKKQEVLWLRNKIISTEHDFKEQDYTVLKYFNPDDFGDKPKYYENDIFEFSEKYLTADKLAKEYFHNYLSFILNEMSSAKVGGNNESKGYSSLWLESADEKEDDFSLLKNLKLNIENSDLTSMHLTLTSLVDELPLSSFRKGDMIILYPENEDGETNIWNNQILKATIKEISEKEIKISLRNKLFDNRILQSEKSWFIEPDYIDSTNKKLYNSLYEFLRAETDKQRLILGIKEPSFERDIQIKSDVLNDNQIEIVNKAVSAKNYFLIQGPPGTGKTSYVLKSIVENIYKATNENLLVMAYTNRAVDEICSALKTISNDFLFLRTGSKESSEHPDVLISSLAETITTRELYIKIRDCRVFVSTVSSVLANPEILELKQFHTAIIDEASQILEPQIIGILSKVTRFILIGDEKQLPAVVTQDEIKLNVDSENLHKINLKNLSISLFERLLLCCKQNGWTNAYGMLTQQARMHRKIQEFPNQYFYNNQLEIFSENKWQTTEDSIFDNCKVDLTFSKLAKNRIVFIESEKETGRKINFSEVKSVIKLIEKIKEIYGERFNETTLGIISPFRAQCAEIYRQMDKNLRRFVMVDTVERFQGSERDIIIITFAVNNEYQLRNMQSLSDSGGVLVDRKLNVAMTRAKEYLIFLGNSDVLSQSPIYSNLINFIGTKDSAILNKDTN